MNLECDVTSNPPAKLSWFKDGAELANSGLLNSADQCASSYNGYYFKLEGGKKVLSNLIICKVNFTNNDGEYACAAKNGVGKSTAVARLQVLGKSVLIYKDN